MIYKTGEKISNKQMKRLSIEKYEKLPNWSYSLIPTKM